MPGCKVDDSSPILTRLREYYRNNGFPSVDEDLAKLFKAVGDNVLACKGRRAPRLADLLGTLLLYKYRQNSSDLRRGSSYGWRVYALFNPETGIMYPIFLFPKTKYQDCSDEELAAAVRELRAILTARASN